MIETIITVAIVLAAVFWFVRWFRGTASGKKGCSCGGCGKDCQGRGAAHSHSEDGCCH